MAAKPIPSLMNYTRSIVPSEGVFWALREGERVALSLAEKTVLGTIANYSGVYKSGKQQSEEAINKAQQAGGNNIQKVDSCHLPPDVDTFVLEFTLKFLSKSLSPEVCGDPSYRTTLEEVAKLYSEKGGYSTLAEMYLARLISGSFLWRNRYGSKRKITFSSAFDDGLAPLTLDICDSPEPFIDEALKQQVQPWIDRIAGALNGTRSFFLMEVSAAVTIGRGQEVYPSQEFVDNDKKSKTLFEVEIGNQRTAGMHSQKIGNAIRTIDIWYPGASRSMPLAVDPFTVDKRRGETKRLPNKDKSDFYSYLKDIDEVRKSIEGSKDAIPDEVHYLMAVLIRGGVFSGDKEEKNQ